jgi:hypothetical protein
MSIPFVIDNQVPKLNDQLGRSVGRPFDVATFYFAISGCREVKERLRRERALRLLVGADPGRARQTFDTPR